ncbi:MAG: HXXEE domain-containing protein [Gemmatimonadaceae bacterium]
MLENSCSVATSGVMAWSLLVAVTAHQIEEFVWPGGFRAWYIGYSPHVERALTTGFLVGFNVLLLLGAALAATDFASPSIRFLWLVLASGVAINGVWHLRATLRSRRYSPGVVTGALLAVPLASYAFVHFVQCGWVAPRSAISAAAYGSAYWIIAEGRKLLKRGTRSTGRAKLSVLR